MTTTFQMYLDRHLSYVSIGQIVWACDYAYGSGKKCTKLLKPVECTICDAHGHVKNSKGKVIKTSVYNLFSTEEKCTEFFNVLLENHINYLISNVTSIRDTVEGIVKKSPSISSSKILHKFKSLVTDVDI